jgi:hypothetical protein
VKNENLGTAAAQMQDAKEERRDVKDKESAAPFTELYKAD